jgi:hypothetical protein
VGTTIIHDPHLRVADAMIKTSVYREDNDLFDLLNDLQDTYAVLIIDGEHKLIGVVTSTLRRKYFHGLRHQSLSLIRPFERLGHGVIIIVDERQDPGLQVLDGKKRAPFEHLAHQNAEPDFDLIHPRTVFGGVMEDDLVGWITQKRSTAGHGGQNATFAFDAQLLIQATGLGDEANQGLGLMDVEIITDEVPTRGLLIAGHHRSHMRQEIFLGARGSATGSNNLSAHHIPTEDKGAGAMTNVLKFAAFHFSRSQGQSRMLALERLHSCELIGTHGAFSLLGHLRGLLIHLTGGHDGCLALRVSRRSEPIADQMRLETPFFNRREACRGEMCWTIPRCISSSAISRPVQ